MKNFTLHISYKDLYKLWELYYHSKFGGAHIYEFKDQLDYFTQNLDEVFRGEEKIFLYFFVIEQRNINDSIPPINTNIVFTDWGRHLGEYSDILSIEKDWQRILVRLGYNDPCDYLSKVIVEIQEEIGL